MPFRFEDGRTPAGHPCLIVNVSGSVELEDAERLGAQVAEGARYHQQRILARVAKGSDPLAETRKYFPTMRDKYRGFAVVVTSPILRATITLMSRLVGGAARVRVFSTEHEAMDWLDALEP